MDLPLVLLIFFVTAVVFDNPQKRIAKAKEHRTDLWHSGTGVRCAECHRLCEPCASDKTPYCVDCETNALMEQYL